MHAMVLEEVGKPLVPAELPRPQPQPGQVLVKILACGVCRTEVHGLPWSNQSSDWFDQGNRHRLYAAVLAAHRHGEGAPKPFVWVYVRKGTPETLSIWRYNAETDRGKWVLQSQTNTGVPGAITPNGSWAVYARFLSTRMTGCFPHGECYNDSGVRFVNYFWDGRAVHYLPLSVSALYRQMDKVSGVPLRT